MRRVFVLLFVLFPTILTAQPAPVVPLQEQSVSQTYFTKITDALIAQRTAAQNSQAICEANMSIQKDEFEKLKVEFAKVKPKPEEK
jgi:hypothetical protein